MKISKLILLVCVFGMLQTAVYAQYPEYPNYWEKHGNGEQTDRPENYQPFYYKYSTNELYEEFSKEIMQKAAKELKEIEKVNKNGPFDPSIESLNKHEVPEWFEDAKLGIFLDWGPWSVPGYSPRGRRAATGGSYPDWYEFLMNSQYKAYHDSVWGADFRRDDFLPLLTGENFDSEQYVKLAKKAGARYIVPFSKHHGGWTMWESEYTKRNAVEMGPKRDIYANLKEAAQKHGLKLGLYFSVSEWEYPVIIDEPLTQWDVIPHIGVFQDQLGIIPRATPLTSFFPAVHNRMLTGKIPVKDYFSDYMMPQLKEGIDKFDPDLLWYDGGWGSPVNESRTNELTAYFYNQAEGRKEVVSNNRAGAYFTEEEMKKIKKLKIEGKDKKVQEMYFSGSNIGDYTTPEYTIGEVSDEKKWEVCRSISPAFGYNWQDDADNSQTSKELIDMFVEIVADGGNLLLVINPDGSGRLSDLQRDRLMDLGSWLDVNGEAIYGSRTWDTNKQGDNYFTQSKDGSHVYIISLKWPGKTLTVEGLQPAEGSKVQMLGLDQVLSWNQEGDQLIINMPEELKMKNKRPTKFAWVTKVKLN